jgi:hypothetical protein
MKLPITTTSSQRWAAGAIGLCLLFACSPSPSSEPSPPTPAAPQLSTATVEPASAPAPEAAPPVASQLGYAGDWATEASLCGDASKTYKLSGDMLDLTPEARACQVKGITEEHPTGRSMIYHLEADCTATGTSSRDKLSFTFGASDTVMQFKLNTREPQTLERCGA